MTSPGLKLGFHLRDLRFLAANDFGTERLDFRIVRSKAFTHENGDAERRPILAL